MKMAQIAVMSPSFQFFQTFVLHVTSKLFCMRKYVSVSYTDLKELSVSLNSRGLVLGITSSSSSLLFLLISSLSYSTGEDYPHIAKANRGE